MDLSQWHFSRIFLNVLQSSITNLAEFGSFLLQLNIKKRMFACEIQRIISRFRLIDWLLRSVVMP